MCHIKYDKSNDLHVIEHEYSLQLPKFSHPGLVYRLQSRIRAASMDPDERTDVSDKQVNVGSKL